MPRELAFRGGLWEQLVDGLAARGGGRRESGAFLLGCLDGDAALVSSVAFYDELDPNCLTGGISFASEAYGPLWDLCAAQDARVVADVHTHPGSHVRQSEIDRAHPMISVAGHVALIFPNYARGEVTPGDIGLHDYLGNGRWQSTLGSGAAARITIGSAPTRRWWQLWHR